MRARMLANQRSRAGFRERVFEGVSNRLRLTRFGHTAYPILGAKEPGTGNRECLFGNGGEIREMTFAGLLLAASLVERYSLYRERIVKVCHGWIIEGDVSVLADADEGKVDRCLEQQLGNSVRSPRSISAASPSR